MRTLHPRIPDPFRRRSRRHRIAAALAAAGIGSLAGALVVPASGAAAPLQAKAAAEFRDSIGVQTHFPFTGFPYDAAPTDQLAGMLRTVGIRHLRDDVCLNTEQACQRVRARMAAMQDALGPGAPKVDLLARYSRELASGAARPARDADIERALTAATSAPLAPMVAALEPVNEPDLKGIAGWEAATLADDATFGRLLAEPRFASLRTLPHLSPAMGHAQSTAALLASGWTSGRADVGNFHPYPPAWGGPENGLTTQCGATTALGCARTLGAQAAPVASETGYSTSGNAFGTNWVSERAQAIYLPRLVLENFRRGVARTYLYELLDLRADAGPLAGSTGDGFGLWRVRQSGRGYVPAGPKPAALALANLNTTIGDLGAGAAPATAIDLSVRAAGQETDDATVRRVLLRREDGSYVLALWQPKAVWRNTVAQQADLAIPELRVDVQIGGGSWKVSATRPSLSQAVTGSWTGVEGVTVPIGADVTLLDLQEVAGPDPEPQPQPTPGAGAGPRDPWATAQSAFWARLRRWLR